MSSMRWLELLGRGALMAALIAVAAGCGDDDATVGDMDDDAGPTAGRGGGEPDPGRDSGPDPDPRMDAGTDAGTRMDSGTDAAIDEDGGEPDDEPAIVQEFLAATPLSTSDDDRFWTVTIHDGKIYAAGHVAVGGDQHLAVARFLPDGMLDASWGDDGIATHNAVAGESAETESARGIAVQSDGRVVIAGNVEHDPSNATFPDADIVVVRFDADGALDGTFENGGEVTIDLGDGYDVPSSTNDVTDVVWGIDLTDDDGIVLFASGKAADAARNDRDRFIVKLTADGAIDTSFGEGDGIYTFDVDGLALSDNQRNGVVLDDGKILAAGYTNVAGRNNIVLLRLNADGTPDATFSADGVLRSAPFSEGMAEAYAALPQSTGRYVTTGYGRAAESGAVDLVSFRYTAAGMFDPSWGTAGGFVVDNTGADDRGRNLAVLPDDRTVQVGSGKPSANEIDAMVVVTGASGDLDPSFGEDGVLLRDFGGNDEAFYGVAVSGDGSLIAAVGYTSDGAGGEDDDATLAIFSVED